MWPPATRSYPSRGGRRGSAQVNGRGGKGGGGSCQACARSGCRSRSPPSETPVGSVAAASGPTTRSDPPGVAPPPPPQPLTQPPVTAGAPALAAPRFGPVSPLKRIPRQRGGGGRARESEAGTDRTNELGLGHLELHLRNRPPRADAVARAAPASPPIRSSRCGPPRRLAHGAGPVNNGGGPVTGRGRREAKRRLASTDGGWRLRDGGWCLTDNQSPRGGTHNANNTPHPPNPRGKPVLLHVRTRGDQHNAQDEAWLVSGLQDHRCLFCHSVRREDDHGEQQQPRGGKRKRAPGGHQRAFCITMRSFRPTYKSGKVQTTGKSDAPRPNTRREEIKQPNTHTHTHMHTHTRTHTHMHTHTHTHTICESTAQSVFR